MGKRPHEVRGPAHPRPVHGPLWGGAGPLGLQGCHSGPGSDGTAARPRIARAPGTAGSVRAAPRPPGIAAPGAHAAAGLRSRHARPRSHPTHLAAGHLCLSCPGTAVLLRVTGRPTGPVTLFAGPPPCRLCSLTRPAVRGSLLSLLCALQLPEPSFKFHSLGVFSAPETKQKPASPLLQTPCYSAEKPRVLAESPRGLGWPVGRGQVWRVGG